MHDYADTCSRVALKAVDTLFIFDSRSTAMGIAGGVSYHFLMKVIAPFSSIVRIVNGAGAHLYEELFFFVFVFNFIPYMKRNTVSTATKAKIRFLEQSVRAGRISKAQANIEYVQLIRAAVQEFKPELNKLRSIPQKADV